MTTDHQERDEVGVGDFPGLPARYRMVRLLGRGSQKRVFLAQDTVLDRLVAIAVIDTRELPDPGIERLHEARAMARVGDYPHVVAVHDVLQGPDTVYIVARYLPGGDLATHLARQAGHALPVREAIRIAAQVSRALECAHEHSIAHRDLKPSNIFFDEHGDAFLGDFGLAQMKGGAGLSSEAEIVGTPGYMAPEQFSGAAVSPSCDLYSLGCVLYELTTGTPPFAGESAADVLMMHARSRPPPPSERSPAISPALSDLILKLLEKDPRHRPASSRDVRAALEGLLRLGPGPAPGLAPPGRAGRTRSGRPAVGALAREPRWGLEELPIVGREPEVAALDAALARTLSGEPGVLLVEGEAGIGKSRLLREVRARAEARGCVALFGQGYEDLALPYRPFVEALLPLASRLAELDPGDAGSLREFLHLSAEPRNGGSLTSKDAELHRLLVAVSRAVVAFSRPRPLILIVDDLHWADSASLDLFEHLAFAAAQQARRNELSFILVGGFRPLGPETRLGRAVARLRREAVCRTLELSGLDDAGIRDLLLAVGPGRPSDQLVRAMRELTEGNPLFVREAVDQLERRGALREQQGFIVSSLGPVDLQMPSSVSSAIAVRTRELSPPCRELLALASFLGTRFDLSVLSSVAGRRASDVIDVLDEAVSHRLLTDEGEAYQFAHPLIRHVFYHECSPTRRRRLHLQVAERLEGLSRGDPEGTVTEIAHHLLRSGSLADAAKVVEYTRRAADQALRKFAWDEAAQLLEAAIAVEQGRKAPSARALAELNRQLGLAHFQRLDVGPCLRHLDAAIEGFRRLDDLPGLARALNDRVRAALPARLVSYGNLAEVRPLEDALERLSPADGRLRATIMGTLAESYWIARDTAKAEELASAAMQLASAEADESQCAHLALDLALVHFTNLHLEDALSDYESGMAHARRANDLLAIEKCLQRIPIVLFMAGRLDEAEKTAVEAREMNVVVQHLWDAAFAHSILVSVAAVRGDSESAEEHAQEGLRLVRRARFPWAAAVMLPALAYSRAMRGEWTGANQAIDLLLEPGLVFDDPSSLEGTARQYRRLIATYAGTSAGADDRQPEWGSSTAAPSGSADFALISSLCAQVELCHSARTVGEAPHVRAALDLVGGRGVVFAIGWPFLIPRIQGIAAALEGQWNEAEAHFTRAIELASTSRARPEFARSCLDYAHMLAARQQPQDRARAAELIQRAAPVLRTCCPARVQRDAQKLAALVGEDQR